MAAFLCACSNGQGANASPSPSPSASPSTEPTPANGLPDANLLSWKDGTIVRSYPSTGLTTTDPNTFVGGINYESGADGPFVFVYELAGVADMTAFAAQLPASSSGPAATVAFAVGNGGPNGAFQDAGTIRADANGDTQTLNQSEVGRWIRITATGPAFEGLSVAGTLRPPPSTPAPGGIYVADPSPYANGAFLNHPTQANPDWYFRISNPPGMSAAECNSSGYADSYPGTFSGRAWSYLDRGDPATAIVNDESSLIVGSNGGGGPQYYMRTSAQPKFCSPIAGGSGSQRVLVLDPESIPALWPVETNGLRGFSYARVNASMLDAALLANADIVVSNMLCDPSTFLSKPQTDALLAWVGAGHKLLIVDADLCPNSKYAFLPYTFTTSNPGAHGASAHRLILAENDALGTSDAADTSHTLDVGSYTNASNQLGDANVVATKDSHWCGHLFGTNANNSNGFMQMYTTYGSGIIIYDGFDQDDADNPGYQRVRTLEFELPVPAGLPCTVSAATAFVVQPTQEATFSTGAARRLTFPMELLANLGWAGHVTLQTTGTLGASVAPNGFDLKGDTHAFTLAIDIPKTAKAGVYTVNVVGDDGRGHTSQAAVTLTGIAPLHPVAKHQRIRIYGIHFDVDSARIQPQSYAVVAQIAKLMEQSPSVRFRVEGYTDSDGGAAYNRGLSQRRAQAVVDALVTRYHIARARLTAQGFGLTHPVAPNTTLANKALNRRVELYAL